MPFSLFNLLPAKLRYILRPWNDVTRLMELAHQGALSIEELTSAPAASGRLKPLVTVMAGILLDLKQQRAERAELEQEIRDRIANRTDALERRIGSLQLQAARDALTGLGNRRALDSELPRAVERYRLLGVNSCLLMIDVDNFKTLNDTLGHPAGDQLLREIAQLIRSTLREKDKAYRCGGDEFVVLLDACDTTNGTQIATRLESLVKALTQPLAVVFKPQLSIGIASLSELDSPTPESFTNTADARLYAVKAKKPKARRSA